MPGGIFGVREDPDPPKEGEKYTAAELEAKFRKGDTRTYDEIRDDMIVLVTRTFDKDTFDAKSFFDSVPDDHYVHKMHDLMIDFMTLSIFENRLVSGEFDGWLKEG